MTKVRPPLSIENTLHKVLGQLGTEHAAEVAGRTRAYLNDACDPDKPQLLTAQDMMKLDLACRDAGDPTFPLWETMGLMLAAASADRLTAAACLGLSTAALSREHGDASAALIEAIVDPGNPHKLERALRETEEVRDASTDTVSLLTEQLRAVRGEPPT